MINLSTKDTVQGSKYMKFGFQKILSRRGQPLYKGRNNIVCIGPKVPFVRRFDLCKIVLDKGTVYMPVEMKLSNKCTSVLNEVSGILTCTRT